MTRQQTAAYARECNKAQALARKTGTPYVKPERPDANRLESLENVARISKKNLRALSYRMNIANTCESRIISTEACLRLTNY